MEKQLNSSTERSRSVPQLRFPEFDGGWVKKKLGEVADVTAGGTPSTLRRDFWNGDIRWMNSGELNLKKVFEVENRITEKGLKNSSTKVLPKFCVMIGLAGQGKTRGTVAMNMIELCTNQSIGSIIPNDEYISEYLYHNLDNRYDELRSLSTGDGGRGGLNLSIIKSLGLSFPTLPEQTKIATFLTAVDEKIQALKKKKSLLEQYKKGIMQKLFSQEVRFKPARPAGGDGNGNDFPDWEMKKLGEGGTFFSGGTPLTSKRQYFNGNIPFIRSGEINSNLTEQYISDEGLKNSSSKIVEVGDLLYALYGATSGEVGISKIKGAINQAILCIRTDLDNRFLYNYLLMKKENIIKTYLQGGQGNLSADIIKSLQIPIPCLKEQTLIANFLSSIDKKINHTQSEITKTEQWKKGLLQKMFV